MSDIEVTEVRVEPGSDGLLDHCLKAAATMAIERWETVVLTHNDVEFRFSPEDWIASVAKGKYPKMER